MKIAFILVCTLALAFTGSARATDFTQYVNPFIGTGAVHGGLSGNNYPGATVPFGMVQLSPDMITMTPPSMVSATPVLVGQGHRI